MGAAILIVYRTKNTLPFSNKKQGKELTAEHACTLHTSRRGRGLALGLVLNRLFHGNFTKRHLANSDLAVCIANRL